MARSARGHRKDPQHNHNHRVTSAHTNIMVMNDVHRLGDDAIEPLAELDVADSWKPEHVHFINIDPFLRLQMRCRKHSEGSTKAMTSDVDFGIGVLALQEMHFRHDQRLQSLYQR